MIPGLATRACPEWLLRLSSDLAALPVTCLLNDAVYYPACGLDGDPIKLLGEHFQSFVYADYGLERNTVTGALKSFRGFEIFAYRDVAISELSPEGSIQHPPLFAEDFVRPPFAIWAVLQRASGFASHHGPDRFSLLFIGGEGVATFNTLYCKNGLTPAVVALIQPGHAFGGNWTNFTDPDGPLAHAVMGNPAGNPTWLLEGGVGDNARYENPCWPSFSTPIWSGRRSVEGTLCLWQKNRRQMDALHLA